MSFFNELAKVHYQLSVPSAILMSIRGRIERRSGQYQSRIGSAFPNGDQSVLLFGQGGTGKTTCMTNIFKGLKMESKANFIESGGMATSIGLMEMMQDNSKSVTFVDEMDWDNKDHLSLFKQVANGKIHRQRAGGGVEFGFDGLMIASTNSITIPTGSKAEHLLATLDRFIVVKTEKCDIDHDTILDTIIGGGTYEDSIEIEWDLINDRLNSNWDKPITLGESALIKELWSLKSRECVDSNREQFRNMHRTKDCLLFVKRMSQCDDICKDKELAQIFVNLVNDLVIVNKGNIVWMDRVQQQVFEMIKKSSVPLSPKDILSICDKRGCSIERRTLQRKLRVLVDEGFVFKYAHGKYGIRSGFVEEQENECLLNI